MEILIVGYGIVGKNMHQLFPGADLHDPFQGLQAREIDYDLAFICVPTPMDIDGSCDTSIVRTAVRETRAKCICIKSTIPPGTTDWLRETENKPCVFSPEYYGETVSANAPDYDFLIVGGPRELRRYVVEAYKQVYPGELKVFLTDARTAELTKYMENAFLATKVTFCQEFYRIAQAYGIDYDELREMFLADPRVGRSHTWVFKDQPYYDSKCLNKDVPALVRLSQGVGYNPKLIKQVIASNAEFKAG